MGKLSVNLSGWELDNPVIASSGTFAYGLAYKDFFDPNILGSFSLKGTTAEGRFGNSQHRTADLEHGFLCSVGLQNPGIDKVLSEEIPKLKEIYHKKVLANVCGFSPEEYVIVAEKYTQEPIVAILELNVSCPNVANGGASFGTDKKALETVVKAVKAVATKPLYVKLPSAVTSIAEFAKICEDNGADGVCVANNMPGIKIDLKSRKPVLGPITGGYSSPALFPLHARMVYQTYQAVNIPVIGVGGIVSAENVIEMMMCGATAVEIGSANLMRPTLCPDIIKELPEVMDRYGIENLSDIIGAAHRN